MILNQNPNCKNNSIIINGGSPLSGEINIQGSKNAALPIMAAALLFKEKVILHNIPKISDIYLMKKLLRCMGCKIEDDSEIVICARNINQVEFPEEYVKGMRSSVLLIGPLLARLGEIKICYPGGCVIGARPINLHLMAMEKLGAIVSCSDNCIFVKAKKLVGGTIRFPFPSVGATENSIMAALCAEGITTIINAAREPEVIALCEFLIKAGAKIEGVGTSRLTVWKSVLHEVEFVVPADRIVAGTYMMAIAGTKGEGTIKNAPLRELECLRQVMLSMGVRVTAGNGEMHVSVVSHDSKLQGVPYLATDNYPGFPTDMQPLLTSVLVTADSPSEIQEQIFEDRFCYTSELNKMGANITIRGNRILIEPVVKYKAAKICAKDLRGGAALVIAGLMAEGTTEISGLEYIQRGYEDIIRDVRLFGGDIHLSY